MFEHVTYEEILERMLARVPDKMDKREGSVIWDTHSPTAIELQILYLELDAILREAYGDTASREFLILRCKERGIYPHEATKAVLRGKFVPDHVVSAGQRFNIGNLNYVLTGDRVDDEEGGYEVQCETAGVIGNQYLGTMIPIEYIPGLQSAELVGILIPGEEEEETEELRKRYFSSFKNSAFGGNIQDYLEKTNHIPGVGSTKVTRVWNGDMRPAELIPTRNVQIWYENVIGTLESEAASWLSAVYTAALEKKLTTGGTVRVTILDSEFGIASNTLLQAVQQALDPEENAGEGYGTAPIGHVVCVKSADSVSVKVNTDLTFDVGYGWTNLQTFICEVISDYLLELRKMWADQPYLVVRISQIEARLLKIKGIVDIGNTKINDSPDNLTLGKYEVPVFGGASA